MDPATGPRMAPDGPTRQRIPAVEPQSRHEARADGRQDEMDRLRAMLTATETRVRTHRDDVTGRTVIQIESLTTGETVDQIPSDDLLRLYAAIRQPLVDESA